MQLYADNIKHRLHVIGNKWREKLPATSSILKEGIIYLHNLFNATLSNSDLFWFIITLLVFDVFKYLLTNPLWYNACVWVDPCICFCFSFYAWNTTLTFQSIGCYRENLPETPASWILVPTEHMCSTSEPQDSNGEGTCTSDNTAPTQGWG